MPSQNCPSQLTKRKLRCFDNSQKLKSLARWVSDSELTENRKRTQPTILPEQHIAYGKRVRSACPINETSSTVDHALTFLASGQRESHNSKYTYLQKIKA